MVRMAARQNPTPAAPDPTPPARAGSDPWSLATFRALLTDSGRRLLAELRDHEPAQELALATRLRREHPADLVGAALTQARLRRRAVAKFGPDAEHMYFTPDGVEQATRTSVAAHRAERFQELGVRRLADLCCGNGGDALALARSGIAVLAVDRSPLACAVVRANAEALGLSDRIEVCCAEVGELDLREYDAVFVDPARRGGQGRVFAPKAYSPPLSWALEVAGRMSHGAVKAAPGVPHEAVPPEAEAEWVSDRGEVKEAVLWFGTGGGVRATLLPGAHALTAAAPDPERAGRERAAESGSDAERPPTGPVGRYLYEPDGAVIRAGQVTEVARRVGGRLIDPSIAYVTSDEPVETPFATRYEVTDVLPFQLKRLRALLRERGVGTATIKKRGSAVEPEELRRRLKLSGGASCVVVLTRVAGSPTVLLARPPRSGR